MRSKIVKGLFVFTGILYLLLSNLTPVSAGSRDKIVIGHPACLSGKYAKAGEQAVGGIKAIVDWVNHVYGGVMLEGKKVPLEHKYYDCESNKDAVTSLIGRAIRLMWCSLPTVRG